MLIVEDEQDLCDCLQTFFASHGFAVSAAFSGEEALERIQQETPDVVLLDILLPGLSGMEVLKRIKHLLPNTRVVMATGLDGVELRAQAHRYGAAAYITKPYDFRESAWSDVLADPA